MSVQQKIETDTEKFRRVPSVLESYAIICGETHMSVIEAMARAMEQEGRDPQAPWPELVRAALAAAEALGWKLVPVEPTQYMKDRSGNTRAADVWRAMLAAAPSVEDAP